MVQLQDALWRDLPALKDPVLHTLDRINVDRHLLDQEVRQQMRVGAARLLAGRWVVVAVLISRAGASSSRQGGSSPPWNPGATHTAVPRHDAWPCRALVSCRAVRTCAVYFCAVRCRIAPYCTVPVMRLLALPHRIVLYHTMPYRSTP